jgi:hypothetical protein
VHAAGLAARAWCATVHAQYAGLLADDMHSASTMTSAARRHSVATMAGGSACA